MSGYSKETEASDMLAVAKMLDAATVPDDNRHFINLETGIVDDPTGIDFKVDLGESEPRRCVACSRPIKDNPNMCFGPEDILR